MTKLTIHERGVVRSGEPCLPRDAMLARYMLSSLFCLSVYPSVCLSVFGVIKLQSYRIVVFLILCLAVLIEHGLVPLYLCTKFDDTTALAVPEILLDARWDRVAMVNLSFQLEVFISTGNKYMKGYAKCRKWGGWR